MTATFFSQAQTGQDTQLVAALSRLFTRAKVFYQHHAERAGPGNLRRQFAELAKLHQQILWLLPPPDTLANDSETLAELNDWYNNKPNQTSLPTQISLPTIVQQLARQLQLQKVMIRSCSLGRHQKALLHFTASLQIAADQLAEIKTC